MEYYANNKQKQVILVFYSLYYNLFKVFYYNTLFKVTKLQLLLILNKSQKIDFENPFYLKKSLQIQTKKIFSATLNIHLTSFKNSMFW